MRYRIIVRNNFYVIQEDAENGTGWRDATWTNGYGTHKCRYEELHYTEDMVVLLMDRYRNEQRKIAFEGKQVGSTYHVR